MLLTVVYALYPTFDAAQKGMLGLLSSGDVVMLGMAGNPLPERRWRNILSDDVAEENLRDSYTLRITRQGIEKASRAAESTDV